MIELALEQKKDAPKGVTHFIRYNPAFSKLSKESLEASREKPPPVKGFGQKMPAKRAFFGLKIETASYATIMVVQNAVVLIYLVLCFT